MALALNTMQEEEQPEIQHGTIARTYGYNIGNSFRNVGNAIENIANNSNPIRLALGKEPIINKETDNTKEIINNSTSAIEQGNKEYEEQKDITATDLEELWKREDTIRKETQEREDSAYQRAVQDMLKAGINPNLIGVSPASAGGGITNASAKNYNAEIAKYQVLANYITQAIANEFTADENTKNRVINTVNGTIGNFMKAISIL